MDKNVNYPLKQSVNNHCIDTSLNPTKAYFARGGYGRQSTLQGRRKMVDQLFI
jgi:hypothetical protein